MATAAAAGVTGVADAGLTVPAHRPHRSSCSTDPGEWQDIRDLLGLATGSKPGALGSGSSDPGSPGSSGGAKDKSPRLSKFLNSGGSVKGEKTSNSQLRPPGSNPTLVKTTSPVQIQLHLLSATNDSTTNNIHQRPRRHSLERYHPTRFFLEFPISLCGPKT